ncbi:unnamed protein product, partial [Prorocentrum cordatum]
MAGGQGPVWKEPVASPGLPAELGASCAGASWSATRSTGPASPGAAALERMCLGASDYSAASAGLAAYQQLRRADAHFPSPPPAAPRAHCGGSAALRQAGASAPASWMPRSPELGRSFSNPAMMLAQSRSSDGAWARAAARAASPAAAALSGWPGRGTAHAPVA